MSARTRQAYLLVLAVRLDEVPPASQDPPRDLRRQLPPNLREAAIECLSRLRDEGLRELCADLAGWPRGARAKVGHLPARGPIGCGGEEEEEQVEVEVVVVVVVVAGACHLGCEHPVHEGTRVAGARQDGEVRPPGRLDQALRPRRVRVDDDVGHVLRQPARRNNPRDDPRVLGGGGGGG